MVPSTEWAKARNDAVQPTNEPTAQSDSEAEGAAAEKQVHATSDEPAPAFDPDAFEAAAAQLRPSWASVESEPPQSPAPVEIVAPKVSEPQKAAGPTRTGAKVIELPTATQARAAAAKSAPRPVPAPSTIADDADELVVAGLPQSPKKGLIIGAVVALVAVLGIGSLFSSSDKGEKQTSVPAAVEEATHAASEAPKREGTAPNLATPEPAAPAQAAEPASAKVPVEAAEPEAPVAAPAPTPQPAPVAQKVAAPARIEPAKPIAAPAKVQASATSARAEKKAKARGRTSSTASARDLVRSSLGAEPTSKPRTQPSATKPKSGVGLVTANPY